MQIKTNLNSSSLNQISQRKLNIQIVMMEVSVAQNIEDQAKIETSGKS